MKRIDASGLLASLQLLEHGAAANQPEHTHEVARLRQLISEGILQHYDRYMRRGKKAVSIVRHGVCTECHMQLSSGANADFIRAEDITTCAHCGRYLCDDKEEQAALAELPEPAPIALELAPKKPRTRIPEVV